MFSQRSHVTFTNPAIQTLGHSKWPRETSAQISENISTIPISRPDHCHRYRPKSPLLRRHSSGLHITGESKGMDGGGHGPPLTRLD